MNRRHFISASLGVCGCCALASGSVASESKPEPKSSAPVTPDAEKVQFTKLWVSRMMDNLDKHVDEPTRKRLMEACGKTCFVGAHGEAKPTEASPVKEQAFLDRHQARFGKDSVRREGNETLLDFWYSQNPRGLKVSDGYCLCPVVEDGPEKLSPTYCHCSVGYVREMFSRELGKPVSVELIRSLRRGDRECRFLVRYS